MSEHELDVVVIGVGPGGEYISTKHSRQVPDEGSKIVPGPGALAVSRVSTGRPAGGMMR